MEKILDAYPELKQPIAEIVLGEKIEKLTAATNSNEAAVRDELMDLREQVRKLIDMNFTQTQTIANLSRGKVVEQG